MRRSRIIGLSVILSCWLAHPALGQKKVPDGAKVFLLSGGQRQHHGYREQALYLAGALENTGRFQVTIGEDAAILETPAIRKYDLIIVTADRRDDEFKFTPGQQEAIFDFVRSGHGYVSIHGADNAPQDWLPAVERDARRHLLALRQARRQGAQGHVTPSRSPIARSPVTQGLKDFTLKDELYTNMQMKPDVRPLATIEYQGVVWPVAWTNDLRQGPGLSHFARATATSVPTRTTRSATESQQADHSGNRLGRGRPSGNRKKAVHRSVTDRGTAMTSELDQPNQTTVPSRRTFLAATGGLALDFMIVPRHVLGGVGFIAPSERVDVGGIGAGGMGGGDIATRRPVGRQYRRPVRRRRPARRRVLSTRFPRRERYKDFREMIDKEAKNIDAVTVGTPDHIHAVASMAAIRAGKHVYCQKPLTHTLHECRELTRAAHAAGVATQMGNQGHATEGARLTNEWIQAGVIGDSPRSSRLVGPGRPAVETGNRPPRPTRLRCRARSTGTSGWARSASALQPGVCPGELARLVGLRHRRDGRHGLPYHRSPGLGLELGRRAVVEARTTLDGSFLDGDKPNTETYPIAAIIYYEFPARGDLPPVRMTWYDGGLMPPAPAELPPGERLPDNGVLYVGSKGKMFHGSHGGMPELLPRGLHDDAAKVPKTIERSPGHYEEWVAACKGGPRPVSNFDYAGPLTEIMLLGVLSLKAPGRAARVGQRKPQDQKRARAESSGAYRISQRMDTIRRLYTAMACKRPVTTPCADDMA